MIARRDEPRGEAEAGFSLTELLVASLIMIVVTTALFTSLEQSQVMFEDYSADMDLRQVARVALSQLSDEVRMAGYDMGTVDEAISIATDTQLQFAGDLDDGSDSGACDSSAESADGGGAERLTYTYDSDAATLRRQVDCWNGSAWAVNVQDTIVLSGLEADGVTFRYFDSTGTRIPFGGGTLDEDGRAEIRSVAIDIALTDEWVNDLLSDADRTDLTLSQQVKLQNRTYDE